MIHALFMLVFIHVIIVMMILSYPILNSYLIEIMITQYSECTSLFYHTHSKRCCEYVIKIYDTDVFYYVMKFSKNRCLLLCNFFITTDHCYQINFSPLSVYSTDTIISLLKELYNMLFATF